MLGLWGRSFCKSCRYSTKSYSLLIFQTWHQKCPDIFCQRLKVIHRQSFSSRKNTLPFEVNTSLMSKDILIYSHKNERFYKLLTYFGCAQFVFWAYLALFSFQNLKDVPLESQQDPNGSNVSWWRRMAAKESKYKNGISILCFCFGYLVLSIVIMFPARSVRSLWLLKGGNLVRLETYSVLPKLRTVTVPLSNITCLQSRMDSAAQIPMKVKGKWFFFLLDKRGSFLNTDLFDFAVGLSRRIK